MRYTLFLLAFYLFLFNSSSFAQVKACSQAKGSPPPVTLEPIAETFDSPLYLTSPQGSSELYIVNRSGLVEVFDGQRILETPFIDLRSKIRVFDEMGLLSLAFHPDYQNNGRVFVFYTNHQPFQSIIAELKRDPHHPLQTLPEIHYWLRVNQHTISTLHRAGQLMFGPDHYLYASFGDAGLAAPDKTNQSYNGKLIRLNVDRPNPKANPASLLQTPLDLQDQPGKDQIYASGFRNPWRFSFDSCTGELFLGDVGSSLYEEINLVKARQHYGWPYFEGSHCSDFGVETQQCSDEFEPPITEYAHLNLDTLGGNAVMGGFVYRGSETQLQGYYIFADTTGRIWALNKTTQGWQRYSIAQTWGGIVSFGQDSKGELYVINITNQTIYKVSLQALPLLDENWITNPSPNGLTFEGIGNLVKDHRYAYGEQSQIRFWETAQKTLELDLAGENLIPGQGLEIRFNGKSLRLEPKLASQWRYKLVLETQVGSNSLELRYTVAETDELEKPERLKLSSLYLTEKQ